jgi:phosphoglycolate phosphatase-like HAD superfamily hydrolase
MVLVADELKRKRAEIDTKIEELRSQIASLERQQAAFDMVIQAYEPEYSPAATPRAATRRKRQGVDEVSELLKDIDRRGFILGTLRHAGRPITTAECAQAFARETGLAEDDARLGQVANRFSQTLDQLAKTNRVRRAGKADGYRYIWEVAA